MKVIIRLADRPNDYIIQSQECGSVEIDYLSSPVRSKQVALELFIRASHRLRDSQYWTVIDEGSGPGFHRYVMFEYNEDHPIWENYNE